MGSVDDELVGQLGVVSQIVLMLLRVADVACAQELFLSANYFRYRYPYKIRVRAYPSIFKSNLNGGLWIPIRIDLAVLDQDPYWKCGSGSRSMEIYQINK